MVRGVLTGPCRARRQLVLKRAELVAAQPSTDVLVEDLSVQKNQKTNKLINPNVGGSHLVQKPPAENSCSHSLSRNKENRQNRPTGGRKRWLNTSGETN